MMLKKVSLPSNPEWIVCDVQRQNKRRMYRQTERHCGQAPYRISTQHTQWNQWRNHFNGNITVNNITCKLPYRA